MIYIFIYFIASVLCAVRTCIYAVFTLRNKNRAGGVMLFILTAMVMSSVILGFVRL